VHSVIFPSKTSIALDVLPIEGAQALSDRIVPNKIMVLYKYFIDDDLSVFYPAFITC